MLVPQWFDSFPLFQCAKHLEYNMTLNSIHMNNGVNIVNTQTTTSQKLCQKKKCTSPWCLSSQDGIWWISLTVQRAFISVSKILCGIIMMLPLSSRISICLSRFPFLLAFTLSFFSHKCYWDYTFYSQNCYTDEM